MSRRWKPSGQSIWAIAASARCLAPATAPKKVEIFDILDQTASAKLTAWWGTDYLLLAKYDGRWMIPMVLWQSPPKDD